MKPILSVKMSSKSKLLPFDLNKKKNLKIKEERGCFGWRDEEIWDFHISSSKRTHPSLRRERRDQSAPRTRLTEKTYAYRVFGFFSDASRRFLCASL